jgi:gluconokinase
MYAYEDSPVTLLILDFGSSSVRALLYALDANSGTLTPIDGALASRNVTFDTEPPGAATFDADALCAVVEACIDELLTHSAARDIRAVGMDTFVGNVLGVDADGNAITPVYLYADTRSADDVEQLAAQYDGRAVHAQTGCRHATAYHPGRFAWLRRTEPDIVAGAAAWIDFGTYLYRRWFGRADVPCSVSAAAWTGLLRRADAMWDADWLAALAWDAGTLPTLADYHAAQTGLAGAYRARWAALADVPFMVGVGDGASANIGAGGDSPARVVLTIGTTAALRVVTDQFVANVPYSLWNYRVTRDLHLIGGATSEGGGVMNWLNKTLSLSPDRDAQMTLQTEMMKRPRAGHGLTFLPLLAGERSPGYHADATGTLHGIRLSTDALDIAQAGIEGIALRLRLILNDLDGIAAPDAPIYAGGGVLASPIVAQIVADALNRPLHIVAEREATARGTAILAARALYPDMTFAPPRVGRVVTPDPAGADAMRAALEYQIDLYARLYS